MISKAKPFVGWFLAGALGFSSMALAAAPQTMSCASDAKADVHNKKKMLKAFTAEFWKVAEDKVSTYPAPLQRKGFVVGDYHFANLGLYFDYSAGLARLSLNDLDDTGTNYLLGDLLKYMVYLRTFNSKKDFDFANVIDAYQLGLKNQLAKTPSGLGELLAARADYFDKKKAKFIEKRKDDFLKFDPTEITPEENEVFNSLERLPLFQQLSHVQRWLQVNDSGSSSGMERYLFLATSKATGVDGLVEFKSLKCSATGPQDRQDLSANFKMTVDYLTNLTHVKTSDSLVGRQRVVLIGNQYLLFREKQPNLINDLDIEHSDPKRMQDYAEFYASYLGYIHSGSADENYRQAIHANKDFILQQLKPIMTEFKARTKDGQ